MVSEFFEKPHDTASEEIVKNCAGLAYAGEYQFFDYVTILNTPA